VIDAKMDVTSPPTSSSEDLKSEEREERRSSAVSLRVSAEERRVVRFWIAVVEVEVEILVLERVDGGSREIRSRRVVREVSSGGVRGRVKVVFVTVLFERKVLVESDLVGRARRMVELLEVELVVRVVFW